MKFYFSVILVLISCFLVADTVSPYIITLYPVPGSTGVPVDADISFHVLDDADGVDISSIAVNINGIDYDSSSENFFYSGTAEDYLITINPPADLEFEADVLVTILASDLADPANQMAQYDYTFQTVPDFQPPYIGQLNPEAGADNVNQTTNVAFTVFDSGIGVDLASIVVVIDGITYTHDNGSFTYSGNQEGYDVEINVPGIFDLGSVVEVSINANDLNGTIMSTFSYQFSIINDLTPPYTGDWIPSPNAFNVPIDQNISFSIYDEIEGVDITTVIVTINGAEFSYLNTAYIYEEIPFGYNIIIDPVEDFEFDTEVIVAIDAIDFAEIPNQMPTFNYQFHTEMDQIPPQLISFIPENGETGVAIDSNVIFHVIDEDTGVDINSLVVMIEGETYSLGNGNIFYSGTPDDYEIVINPFTQFPLEQIISVTIDVSDLAIPANNINSYTYSFQTIQDEQPPFVSSISPEPDSQENNLNANVSFHLVDAGHGVDLSTLGVIVDGVTYNSDSEQLIFEGESNDYYILINPDENFMSGSEVNVSITVADFAPDPQYINNFEFQFECEIIDSQPPFLWETSPADQATDVALDTEMTFYVLDAISDINLSSLIMEINDIAIFNYQIEAVSINNNVGYKVRYLPDGFWDPEQLYDVHIVALDLAEPANVLNNGHFSFTTGRIPAPTMMLPENLFIDEDQALSLDFSAFITNPEGLDLHFNNPPTNNIDLTIDGFDVTFAPHPNWFGSEAILFKLFDENETLLDINVVEITVDPINDAPVFEQQDFPSWINLYNGKSLTVDFAEMILDQEEELDAISMVVSGNQNVIIDKDEFALTFIAPDEWIGIEVIDIVLSDNLSRASSEYEIEIRVLAAESEEKVVLNQHTVKFSDPNCEIKLFTLAELDKIKGKILNRQGKVINKLTFTDNGIYKQAFWNKRNEDNKQVSGGLYIYQIKVDKRLYQGSIIIAR